MIKHPCCSDSALHVLKIRMQVPQYTTMPAETWASRLLLSPRQVGCTVLTALDTAARELVVTHHLEYKGQLPASVLEDGLLRALLRYPAVTGWIDDKSAAADGTMLLCWDTHNPSHPGFDLSYNFNNTRNVPSIYSTWELWKAGALPNIEGRLAAAKVTSYPAADTTLLVFSFDHALFDYSASYKFLQLWLQEAASTATAHNSSMTTAVPVARVVLRGSKPAALAADQLPDGSPLPDATAAILPDNKSTPAGHAAAEECAATSLVRSVDASAVVRSLPYEAQGAFSRNCYFQCPSWTVPRPRADCVTWLQQHQGPKCPFAWDPLDPADSCLQGLKGIWYGSDSQFSVWRIPCHLLQRLKSTAEEAHPLPAGMWYSATTAAAAVLVTTMYSAAPEQATQLGGLHATTVVDLRGGRCGLDIPNSSMANASVSGIRVWVPQELLAAAAAGIGATAAAAADATADTAHSLPGLCRLMQHLRMDLHRQLAEPAGAINKQFEWFEAARRAGLTPAVGLCQGLLQYDAGDIVLDWLPPAAELPVLPGTRLVSSSVRMLSSYMDRIVMAMPVPRADGLPGCDIQFEVSFPVSRARGLYQAWTDLGLQMVAMPAQQGRYWRALDGLVYPYGLMLMLKNTVGCLPWLLLRIAKELTGMGSKKHPNTR